MALSIFNAAIYAIYAVSIVLIIYIVYSVRKYIKHKISKYDRTAAAKWKAIQDPYVNEMHLLQTDIKAVPPLKLTVSALVVVLLLAAVPAYYFLGPPYRAPFGEYSFTEGLLADAFTSSASAESNFGSSTSLGVGTAFLIPSYVITTYMSILRANVPDGNISSYILYLYKWGGLNTNATVAACVMDVEWDEETITARTLLNLLPREFLCGLTNVTTPGWYGWNLTGLVSPQNNTIVMVQAFSDATYVWSGFDSREERLIPAHRPFVEYTYQGLGPPEKPLWLYAALFVPVVVAIYGIRRRQKRKKETDS